jgi:hypothetical protein
MNEPWKINNSIYHKRYEDMNHMNGLGKKMLLLKTEDMKI